MVAIYEYDGLNRRVKKHIHTETPSDSNGVGVYRHSFSNEAWQSLVNRHRIYGASSDGCGYYNKAEAAAETCCIATGRQSPA